MYKKIFYGLIVAIVLFGLIFIGSSFFGGGTPAAANATATPGPSFQVTVTKVAGGNMAVEKGDTVSVWYLGTLEDGSVFDTNIIDEAKKAGTYEASRPYEPLTFQVGIGQMIKGFDDGVVGMKENETKTIKIEAKDAYGTPQPENIVDFPIDDLRQNGIDPAVGLSLSNGMSQGIITKVTNSTVTVDFNHFLAGKNLIFKVTIQKLQKG
ncbi:MAG: peptidylprolyl isomerase [Candidatus Micrarchaeota archaeon]